MPHDKKIPEKEFQVDNINEIFTKEKHFAEPKKYKKEEFWDSISEPQPQPKQYNKYEGKGDRGDRNDRGGNYKKEYKGKRNYEEKPRGDRDRDRDR